MSSRTKVYAPVLPPLFLIIYLVLTQFCAVNLERKLWQTIPLKDKEEMIKANVARLNAHKSRLQELIEFIKVSGFHKIGIANCLSMQKYADKLAEILRETGLPF